MATFKFTNNSTTPLVADKSGTWVLAASSSLNLDSGTSVDGISSVAGLDRLRFNVLGDITLTGMAEHTAVHVKIDDADVMVGNRSNIEATNGVVVDDMLTDTHIAWKGDFTGETGIRSGAEDTRITIGNNGSLTTSGPAIELVDTQGTDTATIKVAGTIDAGLDKAFSGGMGDDSITLTRTGQITGDLDLGAGNDMVNVSRGMYSGTIFGGAGDDMFVLKSAGTLVVENAAEGTDTVKIDKTFTLADNVENLVLTGDEAIDGTGNASANELTGNGHANVLMGMGGADMINGGMGNDTLTGGTEADVFIFSKGADHDMIVDFTKGEDLIELHLGDRFDTWAEVESHISINGADSIIDLGSVQIDVAGVTNLDMSDFNF